MSLETVLTFPNRMQISLPSPLPVSPLSNGSIGLDKHGRTHESAIDEKALLPSDASQGAAERPDADVVSISAEVGLRPEVSDAPAPIYAEIWKGGVKLAQIDVHGHVISYSGLVASAEGGGTAGPLLAAQRAIQVAQQVGGEIRSSGQSLDSQTLLMRARLARTYTL